MAALDLSAQGKVKPEVEIREGGEAPCDHVRALLDGRLADLDAQIEQLTTLRMNIAELRDSAAESDPADCTANEICTYP